ncbi:MAG: hypothetical protein APR54_03155 [Candidatus Cloacimonas sp. SDB]|nr:MAG: hypothetical protein APR54_03155 [Candidatus Cloacimonas sp. SDB]
MKYLGALEARLMSNISNCLKDYNVDFKGPVIVGLSGGKDSITLLLLLNKMGFKVIPVIVDLGYKNFDAQSIASYISQFNLVAKVISVKNPNIIKRLSCSTRSKVLSNMQFLASPGGMTPCSACSQTKRSILINEAKRHSARWIVFGHHRDDFLTTVLKDYFINQYYKMLGSYDAERFKLFVRNTYIDLCQLNCMVHKQLAATMALRLSLANRIELVRPMMYIPEVDIINFKKISNIKAFGSGCAHEVFNSGQIIPITKREIVHYDLRRRLQESSKLGHSILAIALKSLDRHGRLRSNPRAMRDLILPGFESNNRLFAYT